MDRFKQLLETPKFRDGKYFVFDGQHTLLARVKRNKGNHLPVLCKVYFDLSAEEEAKLFAAQTGISSRLKSGERLRAKAFSNDKVSLDFIEANESLGINVSLSNSKGEYRIRCVSAAFKEFQKVGTENYCEAMKIICEAWDGKPSSFYVPVIVGICRFVNLYEDYYKHDNKKITQIAKEQGCSQPTVSVAIENAKKKFIKIYKKNFKKMLYFDTSYSIHNEGANKLIDKIVTLKKNNEIGEVIQNETK